MKKKIKEMAPVFVSALSRGAAAFLALGLQLYIAKAAGPHAYGVFSAIVASASLIFLFGKLGLDSILVKQVAVALGSGLSKRVIANGVKRYVCTSVAVSMLVGVVYFLALGEWAINSIVSDYFLLTVSTGVVMSVGAAIVAALRGTGAFELAEITESLTKPLLTLFICWAVVSVVGELSGENIAVASLVTLTTVSAVAYFLFERALKIPEENQRASSENTVWWPRGWISVTGISLASFGLFQLDKLVLSWQSNAADLGGYNMCSNLIRIVPFLPMILIAKLQPGIASAWSAGEFKIVVERIKKVRVLAFLSGSVGLVFLVLFGAWALNQINQSYSSFYPELIILGVGHVFNSIALINLGALQMIGGERRAFAAQAIGALISTALYFFLIPLYGTLGAAIAASSGMLVSAFTTAYFIKNHETVES